MWVLYVVSFIHSHLCSYIHLVLWAWFFISMHSGSLPYMSVIVCEQILSWTDYCIFYKLIVTHISYVQVFVSQHEHVFHVFVTPCEVLAARGETLGRDLIPGPVGRACDSEALHLGTRLQSHHQSQPGWARFTYLVAWTHFLYAHTYSHILAHVCVRVCAHMFICLCSFSYLLLSPAERAEKVDIRFTLSEFYARRIYAPWNVICTWVGRLGWQLGFALAPAKL
jgi:hypothetical protein